MNSQELYVAERTMHSRLAERRDQIGSGGPGWLSRQSRWLLCEVGYLLVALGARLEAYTLPRYRPLNGNMGSRG